MKLSTLRARLLPKTTLGRLLLGLAISLPLAAWALVVKLQLAPPWIFELMVAVAIVIAGVLALMWLHGRFPDEDIDSEPRDY